MKPFGINGEHRKIGIQIDNAEFRGYILRFVEDDKEYKRRLDENIAHLQKNLDERTNVLDQKIETAISEHVSRDTSRFNTLEKRMEILEEFKNKTLGTVIVIG